MASPAAVLSIYVDANTGKASASIARLNDQLLGTAATAKSSTAGVGAYTTATGKATKATKEHSRVTDRLGGVLKTAAASTAGFVAAYAGYEAVKDAVTYTNELVTETEVLTRVTGLGVQSASKWIQLADERNISASRLASSFGTLSKQINGAETGSGTAGKAFKSLGINLDSLRKMSTEQVLLKVADGLKNTDSSASRAALAQQLFGRSSRDLLPILASGSKGIKDQLDKFEGLSASQYKSGQEARNFQNAVGRAYDEIKLKVSLALFSAGKATVAWVKETLRGKGAVAEFAKSAVDSLKRFWHESAVTRAVVTEAFRFIKKVGIEALQGLIKFLEGWVQIIRGIVKVVSGVLTGNWSRAWDGVKDIFAGGAKALLGLLKGVTAPLRAIAARLWAGLLSGLDSTWNEISELFDVGVNSVIGLLNKLIDAINVIPGIPDIGHIGTVGGSGSHAASHENSRATGYKVKGQHKKQRGGPIWGGDASGDSIPAMLERGEYVLNRKAVQKVGKKQLDAINFAAAPRFSVGSYIGSALGNAAESVTGGGFGAAKSAIGLAGKGAGYFLGKLPKPNLPEPFSGVGPYVINQVSDYIKNGFGSGKFGSHGPGGTSGPSGTAMFDGKPVAKWIIPELLWARKHGWNGVVTSGWRDPNEVVSGTFATAPQGQSEHQYTKYPGGAVDLSDYEQFAQIIAAYKGPRKLIQLGIDPLHFSGTGHMAGGFINRLQKGGMAGLPSWVHGSGTLSADQLASLAHYVGMKNPGLMAQIAQGESSGNPGVTNSIGARGLWQIIPSTASAVGANYSSLTDPLANAKAAKKVLDMQGLGAWEAYTNGSYAQFSKGTISALRGAGSSAGGSTKAAPKINFKTGLSGGHAVSVPALGKTPLLPGAGALPKRIQSMLQAPGIGYAGKVGVGELALEQAERTSGKGDDLAALAFQSELFKRRKKGLRKQLAALNAALGKKGLSPKKQAALLGKREHVFEELKSVEGSLGGVRSTVKGLNETEAGEDPAVAAMEALTEAMRDHEAQEKELASQLRETREYAERASSTGEASAWKALADIMSGNLGATTTRKSASAGIGTTGRI